MVIPRVRTFLMLILGAAMAQVSVAGLPPAELFFQKPMLCGAALSPDGRNLAICVRAKGGRARLGVMDLNTMKAQIVAGFADSDIDEFHWVNDRRLVFTLDVELTGPGYSDFGQGLFAVNADGSNFRPLVESRGSVVKDSLDDRELLHWSTHLLPGAHARRDDDVWVVAPQQRDRNGADYFKLQRLNTLNGRAEEIDTPLHSFSWLIDADGELRAVVTHQNHRSTVLLRGPGGDWKKIADYEDLGNEPWLTPRFLAPDNTLYGEAPVGDKTAVVRIDPVTGKPHPEPVAVHKDFDLHARFVSNDSKLLGLRYEIDAELTQWLDPAMQALQKRIDGLLPSTVNRLSVPRRGDAPWVLVEAFSDVQPRLTLLFDKSTGKFQRVGVTHPGIDPRQMGVMDFVRIPARDGRSIPAYLTLPAGTAKKNLPMVVLVHGGPWVRGGSWRWDAEVQFLASRGYAVLQPEFRGSTGHGASHFEAGFKQWGRAMQNDVADATRWAIAQGHADASRICIAGASYGGYAVLMGLVRDPDLYRCGINWIGVTDIGLMYDVSWSDMTNGFKSYGMPRMIGDPVRDAELLKSVSPLHNAARIRQPLLMAYGAWDVRVPIIHGEKLRDAVKPHNTHLDWVVYDNEGHGWDHTENQVDFWGRVEKFLARHIGTP